MCFRLTHDGVNQSIIIIIVSCVVVLGVIVVGGVVGIGSESSTRERLSICKDGGSGRGSCGCGR